MAKQGPGYWLNPRTGQYHKVYRHELDILKTHAAEKLGLAPDVIQKLQTLNPDLHADEIRVLAMQAGLIRLRDNPVYSVQFYLPRQAVRGALHSVVEFFAQIKETPWNIWLNNLKYDDSVTVSFMDLQRNLQTDQPTMVHEDILPPAADVTQEAVKRTLSSFGDWLRAQ